MLKEFSRRWWKFISEVNFLYRKYHVSTKLLVTLYGVLWGQHDRQITFKISGITSSNRHECNDNKAWMKLPSFYFALLFLLNFPVTAHPVRAWNGEKADATSRPKNSYNTLTSFECLCSKCCHNEPGTIRISPCHFHIQQLSGSSPYGTYDC